MRSTQTGAATIKKIRDDLRGWKLDRALFVADSGMNSIENKKELSKACGKYDGKWVIETNDDAITLEDAACGYKGLMVIERCFRSMKRTQIKICPMYHWVPRRIGTHVKLCVLPLLIERVAEIECNDTWNRIQHNLEGLQVSEFRTNYHKFFGRKGLDSYYETLNESTVRGETYGFSGRDIRRGPGVSQRHRDRTGHIGKILEPHCHSLTIGGACLVDCVMEPSSCSRTITCPTKDIWMIVGEKISETLEEVTLANLAASSREKRQTRAQDKV